MADRLDHILDDYDRRARGQTAAEEQRDAHEIEFLVGFRAIIDSVIAPTLEQVAERLRSRGHSARVERTGRPPVEHARWTNVAIELVMQPSGRRRSGANNCDPFVSFTALAPRRVVEVHVSHALGTTSAGEYELDALTPETVKHIAVDAIEQVLAHPGEATS